MKAFLKYVVACILGVACLAALLAPQSAEAKGYLRMDETFAPTNSPLSGKTIAFLGDSYVQNHRRPPREAWHCRFAEKHGMHYLNYGRNGNCIVFDNPRRGTPMVKRYKEIPADVDYLVVIAGHNDACDIARLGGQHTIKNPTDEQLAERARKLQDKATRVHSRAEVSLHPRENCVCDAVERRRSLFSGSDSRNQGGDRGGGRALL